MRIEVVFDSLLHTCSSLDLGISNLLFSGICRHTLDLYKTCSDILLKLSCSRIVCMISFMVIEESMCVEQNFVKDQYQGVTSES